MAQVRVFIVDPSNTKKTVVEIPDNIPAQKLVAVLVNRMGLPVIDGRGEPIHYRLGYVVAGEECEVRRDQTLADTSIQNDDTLRLYANMTAGGGVLPFQQSQGDAPHESPNMAQSTPVAGSAVSLVYDDDLAADLSARLDHLRVRLSVMEQMLYTDFDLRSQMVTTLSAAILLILSLLIVLVPYLGLSLRVPQPSMTVLDEIFAYIVIAAAYWLHRSWRSLKLTTVRKRSVQRAVDRASAAMNHGYVILREFEMLPTFPDAQRVDK